jgi:two-component system cell cycle response regulator
MTRRVELIMTAKILIVDDVAANTRLLTARLKAEYYQVMSVSDGFSAIEQTSFWQPDLILLDIMMPGMDGFECCRRLKSADDTQHIPIIMLTALGEIGERVRGLGAGADDFLTKPIDYVTLMIRVKSLIRLKRILDEWRARSDTAASFGIEQQLVAFDLNVDSEILVIEDANENKFSISHSLNLCKSTFVSSATELDEAISQANLFNLILLNLSFKPADSLEIISRIRSELHSQQIPILVISDHLADRNRLATAFEIGASDWITVPIDCNELSARCKNLLKRKLYQDRLQDHIDRTIQLVAVDPLTGLYNRRYLDKHLHTLFSAGGDTDVSLLMVDIDHFKSINDRFGHIFGDSIIRVISSVLVSNTRSFDTVSRYGGEEFAILLPGTNVKEAVQIADRLLVEVRSLPSRIESSEQLTLSISIGVTSKTIESQSPASLLHAADMALYKAKCLGRDRLEIGLSETNERSDT